MKHSLVVLFMGVSIYSIGQRANSIQIFYPVYEEFSFNPAIRRTLVTGFTDFQASIKSSRRVPWDLNPTAVGLSYTHSFDDKSTWRLSGLYYQSFPKYDPTVSGQSTNVRYTAFGVDRIYYIWSSASQKLQLKSVFGAQCRIGTDSYNVNSVHWVDLIPYRTLLDFGASAGLLASLNITQNIQIQAQSSFTQWAFLYSNIIDRADAKNGYFPLKPWNQIDFRLSLGYSFGKIVASKGGGAS